MLERFRTGICSPTGDLFDPRSSDKRYINVLTLTFSASKQTGGSAHPILTRASTLAFSQSILVVGLSLTSSIVNATASSIRSAVLALDQGPTLDVSGNASNLFLTHLSRTNSLVTSSPSNRTTSLFFDRERPLPFNASQSLAIYSNGDSGASDFVDVMATIYYLPISF